jgi:hypothetical protein
LLRNSNHHAGWRLWTCQHIVLDWVLQFKSFYPTKTWIMNSCIGNLIFPFSDVPFFLHTPPPWSRLIKPWIFYIRIQPQVHFCWLPFPCLS